MQLHMLGTGCWVLQFLHTNTFEPLLTTQFMLQPRQSHAILPRDMVKKLGGHGVEMESLDWTTWYREEEEQERREREEGQVNKREEEKGRGREEEED